MNTQPCKSSLIKWHMRLDCAWCKFSCTNKGRLTRQRQTLPVLPRFVKSERLRKPDAKQRQKVRLWFEMSPDFIRSNALFRQPKLQRSRRRSRGSAKADNHKMKTRSGQRPASTPCMNIRLCCTGLSCYFVFKSNLSM